MQQIGNPYGQQICPADKPIGIVVIVVSVLHVVASLFIMAFTGMLAGAFASASAIQTQPGGPAGPAVFHNSPLPFLVTAPILVIGAFLLTLSIAQLVAGAYMISGKKWALCAALATSLLFALGTTGTAVWEVAIFIYCLLRLTGTIAPKPI